jgi:tetratricopeptide (TPR) repeat protein
LALSRVAEEAGYDYIYDDMICYLNSSKRSDEAESIITEAIKNAHKNVSLYAARGDFYSGVNRQKEALEDYLYAISDIEALAKCAFVENVYNNIGHIYEMFFNDAQTALKYYNLALEVDNENAYALACIGDIHCYHLKDYQKAVQYYDSAIEHEPEEAKHYIKRADAYKLLDIKDKAEDGYNTALQMCLDELEEDNDNACQNCYAGQSLMGLGRCKEALKYLHKAIAQACDCYECETHTCHEGYFELCKYYTQIGEHSKAKEYIAKAIEAANSADYNQFKIDNKISL